MVIESNAIEPGIHYGMSSARYHAWEIDKRKLIDGPISASMLKDFAPSPYAWRWGPGKKVTAAMRAGSLMDAALTEPEKIAAECVVCPFKDFRTDAAKAWKAENEGKLIVTEEDIEDAHKAARKVREHHEAGKILEDCDFQVAVVGNVGNIPAKCLIDILPREGSWDEVIWDYKTTVGIDDELIRRTMGNFRYHWSAAFYRTLWNKVSTDRHCERFGFIFQDRETYEVRVLVLSDDDMARGTRAIKKSLEEYATAAHRGIRSKYAKGITELGCLPYMAMNEEEWIES